MDLEQWIGMAASLIISTVKNPAKRAKLEGVMFKIVTTIVTAYPQFLAKLTQPTP